MNRILTSHLVLFMLMVSACKVYANESVLNNSSEKKIILCKASIDTWFLQDYSESIHIGITYLPFLEVEVEQKENGLMSLTLKNVVYENPQLNPSARGIGNLRCEVSIDANGNFMEVEPVVFSEGDLEGYDSWDGIQYTNLYDPSYDEIIGTYKDDEFEAVFSIWVDNPLMGNGEFAQRITLNETTLPDHTYSRPVTAGNYGTIVLPFKPERLTGIAQLYSLKGKKLDDRGKIESFVLSEEDEMDAGVPYIFLSNADEITAWAPGDAEWAVSPKNTYYIPRFGYRPANNGLQGTFEAKYTYDIGYIWDYSDEWGEYEEYIPYIVYLLSNNQVVRAGGRSTISAYRAYILSDYVPVISDVAGAKVFYLSTDDTSDINVISHKADGHSGIFDIMGRELPDLRKGINIVNGKKIVK
jgi:hypothetical protein